MNNCNIKNKPYRPLQCAYPTLHDRYNSEYTVMPQIMARAFISFQQLFTTATKRDQRLYETRIY